MLKKKIRACTRDIVLLFNNIFVSGYHFCVDSHVYTLSTFYIIINYNIHNYRGVTFSIDICYLKIV